MLDGCSKALDMASDHLERAAKEMTRAVDELRLASASVSGEHLDQVTMIREMANAQIEVAAGLAMLVKHLPAGQVDLLLSGIAWPGMEPPPGSRH
ncbi:hypothetical protein PY365_11975 [Roseiarcaceae bacterium H3SJ34-1]|uniref:hypothetical protein n=1 Tax=Terripilifer ovatus TaxID=3032367 RepID=UPI003AB928DA|nr:hypothetical protein [Roseiarcaceae bacterium H3SJ34-1]